MKKIDEIGKLRNEGFTQKETALKLNIAVPTVRKYDPLYKPRSKNKTSLENRVTGLEIEQAVCNAWVSFYYWILGNEGSNCPHCGEKLKHEYGIKAFKCEECEYNLLLSDTLQYCYLSKEGVEKVKSYRSKHIPDLLDTIKGTY